MEENKSVPYCANNLNEHYTNNSLKLELSKISDLQENGQGQLEKRNKKHLISDFGAFVHLLKSSFGTGILAMPFAFKNAGTILGSAGLILLLFIGFHCYHLIVESSHILCEKMRVTSLTFSETVEGAFKVGPERIRKFSNFSRKFTDGFLMCGVYVGLFVYIVFVATTLKQVTESFISDVDFSIRIYILMIAPVVYALSFIKNLKLYIPFSIIANTCAITTYAITIYYIFQDIPPIEDREYITDVYRISTFFSIAVFAVEAINMVMQIENEMKHPSHFLGCFGVLNIAAVFITGFCFLIGLVGYLKYGDKTEPSITLNLPSDEILAKVAKILMAIGVLFTFGLFFQVPTEIVFKNFENVFIYKWRCYAYRIVIVTMIVGICIAVPNLGPATSLFGAIFLSTAGLFIPAFTDTLVKSDGFLGFVKWRLWKNIFIMLLSLIILVIGAYTSIVDIIDSY